MSNKYSYEFKLKIVQEYLSGKLGYQALSNKYDISHHHLIQTWVSNYQRFGAEGLKPKKEKTQYSLDFKLDVLHFKQRTGASYSETALAFGLNNPSMIANWKRQYLQGGREALNKSIGRPSKMVKKPSNKQLKQQLKHTESEELERLLKEVTYLKIENAYLKKLKELGLNDHRDPNKPNSL